MAAAPSLRMWESRDHKGGFGSARAAAMGWEISKGVTPPKSQQDFDVAKRITAGLSCDAALAATPISQLTLAAGFD